MAALHWLADSAGTALDLASDQRVLELAAALAGRLSARGTGTLPADGLSAVHDLPTLLSAIASPDDTVAGDIRNALIHRFSDLPVADVWDELAAFAAAYRAHADELALLACRWQDLASGGCAGAARQLHWRGLDRLLAPAPATAAGRPRLMLDASAERHLRFEPDPPAPDGCAPPVACLRLWGSVAGRTSAGIPVRIGRVAVDATSAGQVELIWYVRRGGDRLVAQTAAHALGAVANPFDLRSMTHAFRRDDRRLDLVTMKAGTESEMSGKLALALTDRLFAPGASGAIDATLGAELALHASHRSTLDLRIRPADAQENAAGALRVDLRRTRDEEDGTGLDLGLSCDLSAALAGLRELLIDRAGGAAALLESWQEFIPPSATVRRQLADALLERVSGAPLRAALGAAVGASPAASDIDRLRLRLEAAIDQRADLWLGEIEHIADAVAAAAIDGLALDPVHRDRLEAVAGSVAKRAILSLRGRLRAEVERRAADALSAKELERLLARAESAGQSAGANTGALPRVTGQLSRFQERLAGIAAALQQSAEIKVKAQWRGRQRRESGAGATLSLLIHPDRPGADTLYGLALTGAVDEVFRRLAGSPDSGSDAPATLLGGSLREHAGAGSETGLTLTLLDFELGGRTLLDTDVVIETDASGNIRVCARSSSRWHRWRPGERRDFEAVNLLELATASRTRRMTLSLSLSQIHDRLETDEVRTFFRGLRHPRVGLLGDGQVREALDTWQALRNPTAGELRAWIELDHDALMRLLRIGNPAAGAAANPLRDWDRRSIFETGIDAMVAGMVATGSRTDYRNLIRHLGIGDDPDLLARTLKGLRSSAARQAINPSTTDDGHMAGAHQQAMRLERIIARAEALVGAIETMREVYFASPGSGWTLEDYQRRQATVGEQILLFVKGEAMDRGWLAFLTGRDDIGPYVLAYFKAIAELSAPPAPAPQDIGRATADAPGPLLASILIKHTDGQQTIELVRPPAREAPAAGASPGGAATPAAPQSTTAPASQLPAPAAQPPAPGTSVPVPPAAAEAGDTRIRWRAPMPDLIFPLEKRITTYLQGYRRFDARRSNGRRKHAGCDLVVAAGTPVLAVADGEVVRGPYHFYSGTYALEVEHRYASRTIMVRYGEIRQRVPRDIRPGAKVRQGDVIGFVGQLNSGSHMLHLEMYKDGSDHSSLTVFGLNKYKRRADVMDPTPLLDGAPTLAQSSIASASLPAHPPRPEPTPGRLSNLVGADDLVNVRQAASLVQGEAPLFRLRPSDEFTVLESVAGGRYPYGRGSLWLKIEHGGQTGYVVAHFVDTDFRIPPAVLVPEDSETGFVRDIDGPLNVRGAPSTDAGILGALSAGDSVEVLSEAIGGMYGSGRTDWLEINAAGLDQPGYVAAYYIDIGDDRRTRSDEPQTQRADMSR